MRAKNLFSLSFKKTKKNNKQTVRSEPSQQRRIYEEQTEDRHKLEGRVCADITGMKVNFTKGGVTVVHASATRGCLFFFSPPANPKTWPGGQLQNADSTFSLTQIKSNESA